MTSCAACRGGPGCSMVWTCCLCPAQGWSPGSLVGSHPFMPGVQQVPCLRYLVQLPISYRNSQLLSSGTSPGTGEGLVRDFNLAQIIGLRWNLLPISFRWPIQIVGAWFCTSTTGHSAAWGWARLPGTADPSAIGFLICVCTWWVVRHDNLLQQLMKLRQMISSN